MENKYMGIIALMISVVIGTIYITREVSTDRSLTKRIDQIEKTKDSLDKVVKDLQINVAEKDKLILESIKSSYEHIDALSGQKKEIQKEIDGQMGSVDSLLNIIIVEQKNYEKK